MGSLACYTLLLTMRTSTHVLGVVLLSLATLSLSLASIHQPEPSDKDGRAGKAFSLFSIVQFPNQQCTGSSSSTTYGTCYTSSECTAKGGSADGKCAAGFGVCCVIYTTTCGTSICTNTGFDMYTEFGATSTDSITMTLTYGTSGLTTAKTFNILARQISCTASYKAPTDCTQYFTGVAGNVQSYSYGQMLTSQYYTNCIRTEAGYCAIQWKQSSTTSPDPFGFIITTSTTAGAGGSSTTLCTSGFVAIPDLSMDGITAINVPLGVSAFQSEVCGSVFGVEGQTTSAALISRKQPFILGVYTDTTTAQPGTGFNLDYTQIPC